MGIRKKPVKKQKSNKKVASNDKKENQVAEASVNPTGDQEVKKYHINQISDEEERARLEAESNRLAEDRKRLEADREREKKERQAQELELETHRARELERQKEEKNQAE